MLSIAFSRMQQTLENIFLETQSNR